MVVPAQAQAESSLAMDLGHGRTLTQSINRIPAPGSSTMSRPSNYSLAAILHSPDLDEQILDHWEGYAGSRPVRIGNGAADQLQLDIYGELLDSIYLADRHGIRVGQAGWTKLAQLTDWLCEHWDQPDEGVWETRGGRQNFTYGRLM
jgi:GH15 family glucan-1,4-alpha-glucosidase